MVAELLLEIGTEEIPSGYLEEGLKAFRRLPSRVWKTTALKWPVGYIPLVPPEDWF